MSILLLHRQETRAQDTKKLYKKFKLQTDKVHMAFDSLWGKTHRQSLYYRMLEGRNYYEKHYSDPIILGRLSKTIEKEFIELNMVKNEKMQNQYFSIAACPKSTRHLWWLYSGNSKDNFAWTYVEWLGSMRL